MGETYISTLAFTGLKVEEIIKIAQTENLALEFSSGMPYNSNMQSIYAQAPVKRMPHNYFPAPEIPFVLNLASINESIRQQSLAHCINGLLLAKNSGASFFAAHAGFCIDPNPNELGEKIKYEAGFNREQHIAVFINSLNTILTEAAQLEIDFLVENNVIAAFNMLGNINPLLCCEHKEISAIFSHVNNPRLGLLLDTAHLKVSCNTLGIDKDNEVVKMQPFIKAIHHSDNDGLKDTNEILSDTYWFLAHIKAFCGLPQVIEVKNIDLIMIKQQLNLLQQYGC